MIKLIWTTVFLFSIPVSHASDIHDWDLITDQVMGGKSEAMINIKNWNYVSDNVMGGKSSGALTDNKKYISMQGNVTTKNNGGFIMVRKKVKKIASDKTGVRLTVRGNGEKYILYAKTRRSFPWNFYGAEFVANDEWQTLEIPFENIYAFGYGSQYKVKPSSLGFLGVMAYGDLDAQIDILNFEIY